MNSPLNSISVGERQITPSKIICIGRNYVEHIHELNNDIPTQPVVFLKPNSAISNVLYSFHREQLHYEGEMCFVFESGRFNAVGFGLDLTKRKLQDELKVKGLPWERAKAFDASALFSPFIEISSINNNLSLELDINNTNIQSGSIPQMITKPDEILNEVQTFMTLNDGDIVMTGTPKGVGIIHKGDVFSGRIKQADEVITHSNWIAE